MLLKLVVDNTTDHLDDVLTGILRLHISGYELIDSNAVWLTTAQLAEPGLAHLYRFSAAYLCSSLAEGQNPLLQEAMAWEWCRSPPDTPRCSTTSVKTMP